MVTFGFTSTSLSISGGLTYMGSWDASTNTPALASGVGTSGEYYIVSIPGNTNLDGVTDWQIGDWAIFNGTAWQKIDNSGITYSGTWDANTNTPPLASGVGNEGHFYIVSVAGTTNLNGITDWQIGDWAIYTSGVWQKVDNSDTVGGSGTANEIPYWVSPTTLGSLATATYPNLTEFSYVKGVTSGIQTQLNGKQASLGYTPEDVANKSSSYTLSSTTTYANTKALVDGLATKQNTLTNPVTGTGTNNEISYFNSTGSTIGSLSTSTYPNLTELSYIKGLTSAIQTQLNAKQNVIPNVQSVISSATVTPTSSNDEVVITAQATGLTLANPTGSPNQGQSMIIRIKDDGTARSIGYDTQYRAIGVTLPTTTVINKIVYLGLIYNSTDTKWDVIGVSQQA